MKKKVDLNDYSWILRGKQRQKVLMVLEKEPKIPSEIKEDVDLSLNNVSDVLRSFSKKKLVKCLNPEVKTGRLYVLTEKGSVIKDKISKKKSSKDHY